MNRSVFWQRVIKGQHHAVETFFLRGKTVNPRRVFDNQRPVRHRRVHHCAERCRDEEKATHHLNSATGCCTIGAKAPRDMMKGLPCRYLAQPVSSNVPRRHGAGEHGGSRPRTCSVSRLCPPHGSDAHNEVNPDTFSVSGASAVSLPQKQRLTLFAMYSPNTRNLFWCNWSH